MSLSHRFAIIVSACLAGLLALFLVGRNSLTSAATTSDRLVRHDFIPIIRDDVPRLGATQDALGCFLKADRDSYQAMLSLVQAHDAQSREKLDAALAAVKANLVRVSDSAEAGIDKSGIDDAGVSAFRDSFSEWNALVTEQTKLVSGIFDGNAERSLAFANVDSLFDGLHSLIATMADLLNADRAANAGALADLYQTDLDLHQAYLAQIRIMRTNDRSEIEALASEYRGKIGLARDHIFNAKQHAAGAIDSKTRRFLMSLSQWGANADCVVSGTNAIADFLDRYEAGDSEVAALFSKTRACIDALAGTVEQKLPVLNESMLAHANSAETTNENVQSGMRRSILVFLIMAVIVAVAVIVPVSMTARRIVKVLRLAMGELDSASTQVGSASAELANASSQLAQGASEQAASLEETMSSLDELSSMTRQNAEGAAAASEGVRGSLDASREGRAAMQTMMHTMERIRESSSQTAHIVKSIEEIAFQTNILALNAAVEAARAGDAGRGFAVVAEEVGLLARRSAEAARASSEKVHDAQRQTDAGVRVTKELDAMLERISNSVGTVTERVELVAESSREQTVGIDRIADAARQVESLGQSTAANAEQTASASEELASQGAILGGVVRELHGFINGGGRKPSSLAPERALTAGRTAFLTLG